jgi:hypothetical protein
MRDFGIEIATPQLFPHDQIARKVAMTFSAMQCTRDQDEELNCNGSPELYIKETPVCLIDGDNPPTSEKDFLNCNAFEKPTK